MKPYPPQPLLVSMLHDELVAYHSKACPEVVHAFNQSIFDDKLAVVQLIAAGLPYSLYERIQFSLPFSEQEWATFLELSTKSLQRYKAEPGYHFRGFHAQRILEITELMQAGLLFFGDISKLTAWLYAPAFLLDHFRPVDLLKDSYGQSLLLATLHRMSHGIFV